MIPVEAINEASRRCLARGIRILQGFRLGPTDRAHIGALLFHMAPAHRSSWVDIGCGFGEPAALMLSARHADMHQMPFPDATFDGAMFLYSLCHANGLMDALREAARVVMPGGRLLVFDYLRRGGNNARTWECLGANFFTRDELRVATRAAGWRMNRLVLPSGDDAVFRAAFGEIELYEELFADLVPAIWTATRE